jgi:hypothetical protein
VAFARLDAADVRIDKAFAELRAARERLAAEAKADYDFLQATLDDGVTTRDAQAKALRAWAKQETDTLRTSLDHTQAQLDSERARLQQQRDADMARMTGKIAGDIAAFNHSFDAKMVADMRLVHAALTAGMTQAGQALAALSSRMQTSNAKVQEQYDTLHDLQTRNNALQQTAIDDLQRDTLLEKQLSQARLAALDGNISGIFARLQTVKGEIVGEGHVRAPKQHMLLLGAPCRVVCLRGRGELCSRAFECTCLGSS